MRSRRYIWIALCLLCVAGAWLSWHAADGRRAAEKNVAATASAAPENSAGTAPLTDPMLVSAAAAKTNRLAYRLSNTTRTIGELTGDRRAILLENALIDSSLPVHFSFPKNLLAQGDPGAYIVQARGLADARFRAALTAAGATEDTFKNYIPNNAYLARLSPAAAESLKGSPLVQSVIPYEPYYKLQSSLLGAAVKQSPLPAGAMLILGLFAGDAPQTISAIENLGGTILARETSPFGPVVRVRPPADWTALAALSGVQIVEAYHSRVPANDLSRVTTGVATNTLVSSNYMNLTGLNVMVDVNDTGIDATHPDFTTGGSATGGAGGAPVRVIGDAVQSLVDTNGHGTHVAGIIAGNGAKSYTTMSNGVQMAEGSVSNADFRGRAPLATLYSVAGIGGYDPNAISDQYMQEQAALTNALISNNSWGYGNNTYDLAAASYDAATRDALPEVTGSQPVLFVFAAGNGGHIGLNGGAGDNNGGSVTPDTITSPGTAKNVITVGALEQMRNITDSVTNLDGSVSHPWQPETDTGYQVAYYSSRGNVGVGIEGANGRLKPDVAAPGSFVVFTRSSQWATNIYYNPTNYNDNTYTGQSLGPNGINYYSIFVPQNAVSVTVQIQPNKNSPNPMPDLPIYVSQYDYPDPTDPATYDFVETTNEVLIPPDGVPDGATYLTTIQGTGFNYAVVNTNLQTVNYNLFTEVATTNDLGNYFQVLEGMNDGLGGYYRYESGTSMAAADVSGTLALIQDFFTNQLQMTPSPALLKAMLINGARPTLPNYNMRIGNPINNEGWGLINLPNSLPTNNPASYNGSTSSSIFIQDQSPTNALATGDSHTFALTIPTNAPGASLRLTLTWTDPPGDPVAAIKLVNGLELVVTNLDNPTNPVVYYGNDITANGFNTAENATNTVSVDTINNVQNVFIPQPVGTNYTVTVIGREVNVTAVSAQTNLYAGAPNGAGVYAPNVVQDYALVISCGDAFTVTDKGIVSNPTGDQNISIIATTNTANSLLNQFVGANSPVLNTNAVSFTSNTAFGGSAVDTLGTTNQWHFFVVTNNGATSDYTNAAFVIYSSLTLSVPRMGVFADSVTNATMPQANIDLYATTDPTLTNLNPVAISNCINEVDNGASVNNASLARGGDKFIVFSNSAPGDVYYIGVKSEDQMASEYSFLSVFSNVPFDQNDNGDEILTGLTVPAPIPGGNPSVPGYVDVVAIAVQPIQAASVIVTNIIQQTDVGDLVSSLSFNNTTAVLMNHDSPNSAGTFGIVYDDSGTVDPATLPVGAGYVLQHADGPGSLQNFVGQNVSSGVWVFHVANSVEPFTGSVQLLKLRIHPHLPLTSGVTNAIPPHTMIYDFVDVPAGATNLTINATNITFNPDLANPLLMVLKFGSQPTLTNADKGPVALINGIAVRLGGAGLGNSLSVGPTDVPPIQPGRYWVGITNQSDSVQTNSIIAVILPPNPSGATTDFVPTNSTQILDDAVTYSDIFVTNTLPIVSVNAGIVVQDPRISDLVFHLISPDGTRILLMENRGGADTSGAGLTVITTNIVNFSANGTTNAVTNSFPVSQLSGTLPISWNFFTIPDQMTVYAGTNNFTPANLLFDTGMTNGASQINLPYTTASGWLTIIMNQFGNPNGASGDAWTYTAGGLLTNYYYLAFTEDTNLTTTPIKFAPPPFVPMPRTNYLYQTNIIYTTNAFVVTNNMTISGFESDAAGDYVSPVVVSGWKVISNQVSIVTDPLNAYQGSNFLALASGVISNTLPTVPGNYYTLTFAYRGPGVVGWWRAENNTNDSIYGDNGYLINGASYASGKVGQAFSFDNSGTQAVDIPRTSNLNITNEVTVELWMNANAGNAMNSFQGLVTSDNYLLTIDVGNPNVGVYGIDFDIDDNGADYCVANVNGGGAHVSAGAWHHVVGTYDGTALRLYIDGQPFGNPRLHNGTISPMPTSGFVSIGSEDGRPSCGCIDRHFWGLIDESSIYNRALSKSEINAIYNLGTNNLGNNGKYDQNVFNTSPAESLAEAQISINGQTPATFLGNNTNWQVESITFKATQSATPLQISGLEPGMLLDSFAMTNIQVSAVTNVVTNAVVTMNNLYYLPEQSLDAFTGTSANGDWRLEIQDDRAGAGLTNSLVSWELQFVFANTNAIPAVLSGGIGQSSQFIPAGDIAWYQINVPANANYATNILKSASAPVNVWFSANVPPTIINPSDVDLIPNSTGASALLSTNGSPVNTTSAYIVPGGTYYLGVQNMNAFTVNYGIEVDFDHGNATNSGLPALIIHSVKASGSGTTMEWTASPSAQFQMQWKNDLTQPWNTDTNVITSSDGNFNFTDDGSQTGPLGTQRFYRLVQISP